MSHSTRATTALPRRRAGITVAHHADASVLTSRSGAEHTMNATALALWELCDGDTSVREMVNALDRFFDADRADIEVAVVRMLEELSARGLLDWSSRPMPPSQRR